MKLDVLTSSKSQRWRTPPAIYEPLAEEFGGFLFDAAAERASCIVSPVEGAPLPFFGPDHPDRSMRNMLTADWARALGEQMIARRRHSPGYGLGVAQPAVWLNPVYGTGIAHMLARAADRARNIGITVVNLVNAKTDVNWWANNVVRCADEVRFYQGRICFREGDTGLPMVDEETGQELGQTVGSAVVVFRPWIPRGGPRHSYVETPAGAKAGRAGRVR